jgi:hypothetical protein
MATAMDVDPPAAPSTSKAVVGGDKKPRFEVKKVCSYRAPRDPSPSSSFSSFSRRGIGRLMYHWSSRK